MNLQGTIVSVVPDGGYQSKNGYISTFQMTIQTPQGTYTGQIGAKSQVYPIPVGGQINVVATQTEHGVRFKKYDPQYGAPKSQQIAPQNARQGPSQARQAIKSLQPSPDSLFIGKQAVWKGYCEAIKNNQGEFNVDVAIEQCWKIWNGFMIADREPLVPAGEPKRFDDQFVQNHPVEQDDVPWENS